MASGTIIKLLERKSSSLPISCQCGPNSSCTSSVDVDKALSPSRGSPKAGKQPVNSFLTVKQASTMTNHQTRPRNLIKSIANRTEYGGFPARMSCLKRNKQIRIPVLPGNPRYGEQRTSSLAVMPHSRPEIMASRSDATSTKTAEQNTNNSAGLPRVLQNLLQSFEAPTQRWGFKSSPSKVKSRANKLVLPVISTNRKDSYLKNHGGKCVYDSRVRTEVSGFKSGLPKASGLGSPVIATNEKESDTKHHGDKCVDHSRERLGTLGTSFQYMYTGGRPTAYEQDIPVTESITNPNTHFKQTRALDVFTSHPSRIFMETGFVPRASDANSVFINEVVKANDAIIYKKNMSVIDSEHTNETQGYLSNQTPGEQGFSWSYEYPDNIPILSSMDIENIQWMLPSLQDLAPRTPLDFSRKIPTFRKLGTLRSGTRQRRASLHSMTTGSALWQRFCRNSPMFK